MPFELDERFIVAAEEKLGASLPLLVSASNEDE